MFGNLSDLGKISVDSIIFVLDAEKSLLQQEALKAENPLLHSAILAAIARNEEFAQEVLRLAKEFAACERAKEAKGAMKPQSNLGDFIL